MMVFSALGLKCYYYRISLPLICRKRLHWLSVTPISMEDIEKGESIYYNFFKNFLSQMNTRYSNLNLACKMGRELNINHHLQDRLLLCFLFGLKSVICDLCSMATFASELKRKKVHSKIFFISSPKYFSPFPALLPHFCFSLSVIYRQIIRHACIKPRTHNKLNDNDSFHTNDLKGKTFSDFEVLYFPHQGIWYGNLFKKDHFYIKEKDCPFHPSKILHLSIGDTVDLPSKTLSFYNQNDIPFWDFSRISLFSWRECLNRYLKILFKNKQILFSVTIWEHLIFFKSIHTLNRYSNGAKKFTNAKVALLGYASITDPHLVLGLSMNKINVVATEERLLQSFHRLSPIIADYYFVLGGESEKILKKDSFFVSIKKIIPIGPIRLDLISSFRNVKEQKYTEIKKMYFLFLVCDYHSTETEEENRFQLGNNWKMNKRFYKDMIQIAKYFPNAYFAIKGKNTNILKNPNFIELINEIKKLPNIAFEEDLDTYSPYLMAHLCDACIALHTSLGDEILAAGKPVVFYDWFGYPTPFFNYKRKKIIAENQTELKKYIEEILQNKFLRKGDLKNLCTQLYSSPPSPACTIKSRLDDALIRLIGTNY